LEPPLVEARATPVELLILLLVPPTAIQNVELVHETSTRPVTVEGIVPCVQVEPPSVDETATPVLLLVSPIATQNVELVQKTSVR
jgi:hypothetical protein